MTKPTALKREHADVLAVTEGFESQPVVASNDPGPPSPPNKVEELRERIRAARLETMLARRLENELSIDPNTLNSNVEPEIAETPQPTAPPKHQFAEQPVVSEGRRAADAWTRSRFRSNRQECETLVHDFAEQANSILKLADRSGNLLDYLDRLEQDLEINRSAEIELNEKTRELERLEKQRMENLALIEKQSKQIDMLESMRRAATDNFDSAKRELDGLQLECDRKESKFNELNALASRLERENVAISERHQVALRDLENANDTLSTLREKTHEQDRQLSLARTEIDSASTDHERALSELSNLQIRYNELNKKSLEHQGQHYSRINELEETVRDLRAKMEQLVRERDDTSKELEAANNLLMLHEEMITTLSDERG